MFTYEKKQKNTTRWNLLTFDLLLDFLAQILCTIYRLSMPGVFVTQLQHCHEKGHSTVMKICSTFNNSQSSHMEIAEAVHKLLFTLYGTLTIYHHYLNCRNFHRISWWGNFLQMVSNRFFSRAPKNLWKLPVDGEFVHQEIT